MGKISMRPHLVAVWIVSIFCLMTVATEAGDPRPRRPTLAERSSLFQAVPHRTRVPTFFANNRRRPAFGLRVALTSHEDPIEFLPPIIVESQSAESNAELNVDSIAENAESNESSQILDLDVFDKLSNEPSADDLPPMASVPKSKPGSSEAVPIDGAKRDDGKTTSEEKQPPATTRSSFGWIAGTHDKLGLFELDFEPLSRVRFDATRSIALNADLTFGAKWLQGPDTTDLPPYLFNILINVGMTHHVSDRLTIDAMISPGWYTDFSNKGTEAFRLPWHLVSYYKSSDDWRWVFGVTDLSRQDIRYLPVVGAIYAPDGGNVRWDLVFPKPRIAWRVGQESKQDHWMYFGGELGGGSWAISRADRSYDIVTYRDLRLVAGLETQTGKGHASRIEVGWIIDRSVEYRSNLGNYNPSESLMIRLSSDY